jgi:hypothetical protein
MTNLQRAISDYRQYEGGGRPGIYEEGEAAFYEGKQLSDCPYDENTVLDESIKLGAIPNKELVKSMRLGWQYGWEVAHMAQRDFE